MYKQSTVSKIRCKNVMYSIGNIISMITLDGL